METIQIVLDKPLLKAANKEAKRAKMNRSALVRQALREYFKRLELRAKEEQDRLGYLRVPDQGIDPDWEAEAVWPED